MAPLILLAGMQAADVVRFVFGEKWLDMIPLVRFFAAIGLIQCINAFHDSFLVSQGKTSLLLRITFIEKTLLVVSVFFALQFGLIGLLWAKVLVLLALFIPRSVVITQVLGTAYRQWLRNFYPEVVALLIMMVMVFLFVTLLSPLNYILRLGIVSVVGLGVYYFCLRILSSTLLQEVERIVKHRISTGQYL
jgi:O-antigen/teichoic acid export membrane protein